MRGKTTLAAGLVLCVLAGSAVLLAAGDPDQTLVPLSYLTGTYIPDVAAQGNQAVDEATQTIYQSVLNDMQERQGDYLSRASSGSGLLDRIYPPHLSELSPSGTVSPVPAWCAAVQAAQALCLLCGRPTPLWGKLLAADLLYGEQEILPL